MMDADSMYVFRLPLYTLRQPETRLEQAADFAVFVHINPLGGGRFGQPRHFHHRAAQRHDKPCACGYGDAAHVEGKAFGLAEQFGVVAERILRFCHANRQLI